MGGTRANSVGSPLRATCFDASGSLKLVQPIPRGRLLEIGCGSGALLADLADDGFQCNAIETSAEAVRIASIMNSDRPEIDIRSKPSSSWEAAFDSLVAFEVLEHQEDDLEALTLWTRWLRQGGHLMLSVPGHPDRWNATDVWAGHFRRYDKESLSLTLENSGYQVLFMESYGFPVANIIEPVRARHHSNQLTAENGMDLEVGQITKDTQRSGIERPLETRLFPLQTNWLGTTAMRLSFWLQNQALARDWGTGYIALAQKK